MSTKAVLARTKPSKNGIAGKIVLIADDEADVRRLLRDSLKEREIKVVLAARGNEVLRILEKQHVDCVVLDIVMPDNGIETAIKVQRKYPRLPILFLTGFGDLNRKRSSEKGVWVERWIDKGPNWLEKASAIIVETLQRPRLSELSKIISAYVSENSIDIKAEAIYGIASSIEPAITSQVALAAIRSPAPETVPVNATGADSSILSFEEVMHRLRIHFVELREGFKDPTRRRIAWLQFRKIAAEQLWLACEPLVDAPDKYRQQLADQLTRAVQKIKATDDHALMPEHIKAIALSLERLSSDGVSADDVHECKRAWQLARVETLPSFGNILRKWEEYYGEDDGATGQEAG